MVHSRPNNNLSNYITNFEVREPYKTLHNLTTGITKSLCMHARFVTPALETVKGITLNESVLKWVDEQISIKGFRNRSNVIEYALERLRKSNSIY